MKKLALPLLLLCYLTCSQCNVKQSISDDNKRTTEIASAQEQDANSNLSTYTKLFIRDLDKELETIDKESYKPSESLSNKYNIIEIEGAYYIGGMIKVNDELIEPELMKSGVLIGTKSDELWSIKIPILSVENISTLNGILYLQVDEPVYQKNLN